MDENKEVEVVEPIAEVAEPEVAKEEVAEEVVSEEGVI